MSAFIVASKFTAKDAFTKVVDKLASKTRKFASTSSAAFKKASTAVTGFETRVSSALGKLGLTTGLIAGLSIVTLFNLGSAAVVKYDSNIQSLQAITGVTGKQFETFESQINDVSKAMFVSGDVVAKSFEQIGSAKPELLGNAAALAAVSRAAITLSKASRDDLQSSTASVTSVLNQFELQASASSRVINVLAAGAKEGAAAIPLIAESINRFGAVAKASNVTLEESVSLVEILAEKSIVGADAGTSLRNVINKLAAAKALPKTALDAMTKFGVNLDVVADKTIPFKTRLAELAKIQNDADALTKVFGVENLLAGQIILKNVEKFDKLTGKVTATNEATKQASINNRSFVVALENTKAAFQNVFIAANQSSGALSGLGSVLNFASEHMSFLVGTAGLVIGSLLAISAVTKIVAAGYTVYAVVLGIMAATNSAFVVSANASKTAMLSMAIATKVITFATSIWTGVQWALNAAQAANPAVWIILAIIAAIAVVVLAVKNWGKITEWISNKWRALGKFFNRINWVALFRKTGAAIIKFLLTPLRLVLKLISKIPGAVGAAAQGALSGVDAMISKVAGEQNILATVTNDERQNTQPLSTALVREQNQAARTEFVSRQEGNIGVTIKDDTGRAEVESTGNVPFRLATTTGGF